MKVLIKQSDIDDGRRGDCHFCAVAIALRRYGFKNPNVNAFTLGETVYMDGRAYAYGLYKTPPEVVDFMERFDNRETVQPFEFDLDLT